MTSFLKTTINYYPTIEHDMTPKDSLIKKSTTISHQPPHQCPKELREGMVAHDVLVTGTAGVGTTFLSWKFGKGGHEFSCTFRKTKICVAWALAVKSEDNKYPTIGKTAHCFRKTIHLVRCPRKVISYRESNKVL